MPCYHPIPAWRPRDLDAYNPATGKAQLVFNPDRGLPSTKIEIPCGQCIGCRLDRARSWAVRCLHEASLHDENCFLTLTYSDEHLPENNSLNKRDIQLFMKRLRKRYPEKPIRFFQCGEYGEQLQRPHHHVLLFNFDFPDKKVFGRCGQNTLYLSKSLSELWPFGIHSIGSITFDSACYTARYILKKVTGKGADDHYAERSPEFVTMSRKPGIGKDWYEKWHEDLYRHDKCVVNNDFIARPPKYYDRIFDIRNPRRFAAIKATRKQRASSNPNNSDERLATREKIQLIKQEQLERKYEKN